MCIHGEKLFGYSVAELRFDGFGRLHALVAQSFYTNKCKIKCAFGCKYETDSFERIQSSPSPLAGDPDPVQSDLVDQKSIQPNPIRLVRTEQILVHCVGKAYTQTYSFVNFLHEYVGSLLPEILQNFVCFMAITICLPI